MQVATTVGRICKHQYNILTALDDDNDDYDRGGSIYRKHRDISAISILSVSYRIAL